MQGRVWDIYTIFALFTLKWCNLDIKIIINKRNVIYNILAIFILFFIHWHIESDISM